MLRLPSKNTLADSARRAEEYAGQLPDSPAWEYLTSRGLTAVAEKLKFGYVGRPICGDETFAGRLSIPTISPVGNILTIVYRALGDGKPKYLATPGMERWLYNPAALHEDSREIHVCEGEIDAATLTVCGLPAVGISGANAWKKHYPALFSGFSMVYSWVDPDDAGNALDATIRGALMDSHRRVRLPDGYDVNSLYVDGGRDAIRRLSDAHRFGAENP